MKKESVWRMRKNRKDGGISVIFSSPTNPVNLCLLSQIALTALLAKLSYTGSPSSRLSRVNSSVKVPAPAVQVSRSPPTGSP